MVDFYTKQEVDSVVRNAVAQHLADWHKGQCFKSSDPVAQDTIEKITDDLVRFHSRIPGPRFVQIDEIVARLRALKPIPSHTFRQRPGKRSQNRD